MFGIDNTIKYSHSLTLLYVEDNLAAQESTLIILEEFFDTIITAIDGEDGLNKFKNNKIDIIFTDINMPKMNGIDMITKIRTINDEIPIIILSAYNESGYFMESIRLGVEGFLLKPIEMDQFTTVLEKTIEKVYLKIELENKIQLLKQYQEATDNSSIVSKTDTAGRITYANSEFVKVSGFSMEELLGKNHNIVRHPDNPTKIYSDIWNTIQNKQVWKGIIRNLSKDKHTYYVNTTIKPILDRDGNIIEYIALRDNVSDIMNPKKQLQDLIDGAIEPIAVMLKIENFEDIESFYGQSMLQLIEDKLSHILETFIPIDCEFEKIYALGYGEYVFAKDRHNCHYNLEKITQNLKVFQECINNTKINIGDLEYDISILLSFSYGENVLENLRYGIKKLHTTKQNFIFSNDLAILEYNKAKENIETLKIIKEAIGDFKIVSYFQAIIDNKTQKVAKYESLVRLISNDGKVLSPYLFLETAKKGRYYNDITSIVLTNSFKALRILNTEISINISAIDIEKTTTRETIFRLIKENESLAHRVVFELLEDEHVKDFDVIKSFIQEVKKSGVKIAIDDFGSGYSNFGRLLDYQPDILKIDGSLIKNILTDSYSLNVVETIIAFAKKQNIKIIAEFVENEAIFNLLKELDIDYSQGYYFAKPDSLENILRTKL